MMKNSISKYLIFILIVSMFISLFSFVSTGADTFETQIAAFPESYKSQIRELHKKYPNWIFKPVDTGLDWYDAVKNEGAYERNAVPLSSGKFNKNLSSAYYNASTGVYKQTDAGWVNASPEVIEYFLDPRNFLYEDDIFQFELLSFSSDIKVSDVEEILKGTFMYNTNITYTDTKGATQTTTIKYSKCIFDAGKNNNINPCFLAAKIKNEVTSGGQPSGSVSGKRSGYIGYYNFYNIGAYAGTDPIANGLKYASASGSYERPWDTPMKAISGGAKWIAEGYIAKGQDTGYFQKFNVSPYAASKPYNHQYMSNVSGACSQGYSSYKSYVNSGNLTNIKTFAIPIFKNMPGADAQSDSAKLFDSNYQTAKPSTVMNVRTEPSTSGKVLVSVRADTQVTVLSKCRNNTRNYYQHLNYPFWYYISFTQDGTAYKGYAVASYNNTSDGKDYDSFIFNTSLNVNKGDTIEIPSSVTGSERPALHTWDTSVISISSDFKVTALKNGTAYISATSSKVGYDYIKVNVGSYSASSLAVTGFSAVPGSSGQVFSWNKVSGATGYELIVYSGNLIAYTADLTASKTSVTVTSLDPNKSYSAKIRAYKTSSSSKQNGAFTVIENIVNALPTVTSVKCSNITASSFTLSWKAVKGASGYQIRKYNTESKTYETVKNVTSTSYTISSLSTGFSGKYKVRAYVTIDSKKVYGPYSSVVEGYTYKSAMKLPTISSLSASSATIKWSTVSGVNKYNIYLYDSSAKKFVLNGSSESNSYKITSLSAGNTYKVKIEAINVSSGSQSIVSGCEFEFNSLPPKVTGIKEVSSTTNEAKISWTELSSAKGYRVYVLDEKTNTYNLVKEQASTSYTFKDLSALSDTKVKVCALAENSGVKYEGSLSSAFTVYTGPKNASSLSVNSVKTNSVSLKWKSVSGATGYNIYLVDSKGNEKLAVTTEKTSATISSLKSLNEYKFYVVTQRKVGSTDISGSKSSSHAFKTAPSAVNNISYDNIFKTNFTLHWDAKTKADGYYIYRYNDKTDAYEKIGETTENSFTVSSLTSAKTYSFKISAFVTVDGKNYSGTLSSEFKATTIPKDPGTLNAVKQKDGSVKLSWNSVTRATGYRVYIYSKSEGKWLHLCYTTKTSYIVSADKVNKYGGRFRIRSYIKSDGVRYYSANDSRATI